MKNFNFTPGVFKVLRAIFFVLGGAALVLFVSYIAVDLHYPLWLKMGLYTTALLFLYEGMAMLFMPISFSLKDGNFRAGYLISNYKFNVAEIERYTTISYPTRFGVKNSVVIYLKNNRAVEISELLINCDISIIKTVFEQYQFPNIPACNRTIWFPRFPKWRRS